MGHLEEMDEFLQKNSKTEPGRNRKYELTNHKHGYRNCNKKFFKQTKAQG